MSDEGLSTAGILLEKKIRLIFSENVNNNEYLPGHYKDLTSLKHTVLQIHAPNHESLDFFIGFHL